MKKLLTCSIAIATFLSLNGYANTIQPDCSHVTIENIETDLANAGATKKSAVLDVVAKTLDYCRATLFPKATAADNQIQNFYRVINQVLATQLRADKISACLALGAATTEPWDSTFPRLKNTATYSSINATIATCNNKREKNLSHTFPAEPCPLFGPNHKYSSAIALPANWKIAHTPACLYLDGGKNRSKPEEEGIALRENNPHLVLLTQVGETVSEQYIDLNQGYFAAKNLCLSGRIENTNFLSASGNHKKPLIRIRSYAEHCVRDSVALKLDTIYQINSTGAITPVDELVITLQK